MGITATSALLHWNYFLALESDLARLSRFVEFNEGNFDTYSIEMVHLLLATCSEVDVVMKQLCEMQPTHAHESNMDEYRALLANLADPALSNVRVSMSRFGLELTPWANWSNDENPDWWRDHNKVKHTRAKHYQRANLKNVLNAVSGLFVALIFHYRDEGEVRALIPAPQLLMAPRELINQAHTLGGETGLFYDRAGAS